MKEFIVKENLPEDVIDFLDEVVSRTKGYTVYLGGGYLRDMYCNHQKDLKPFDKHNSPRGYRKPKDLDLFFIPDQATVDRQLPTIPKTYINYDIPAVDVKDCRENVESVRGLFYSMLSTRDIQFIVYDKTLTIRQLAEDMDTNINQIMYHPSTGKQFTTQAFYQGHKDKVIEMLHEFETSRM